MKTQAAILVEQRRDLVVDEVELPMLGCGHVLVQIHATRICGSQLGEIDGVKGPDRFLPHLLGHEAGGTVMEIGPGVTQVKPGDEVVLHWRPALGIQASPVTYQWGSRKVNAGNITTFQQFTVISENRLTKVPAGFDPELSALLADTLTTGIGTICREATLAVGESCVVIGVGGIGLGAVLGAGLAGAHPLVAVDIAPHKLEAAARFGATHLVNSKESELGEALAQILPQGADLVVEVTGNPEVAQLAWNATAAKGRMIMIGVMRQGRSLQLNTLAMNHGKRLLGTEGGASLPHIDIPRYVAMIQTGRFDPKPMITHRSSLENINQAIARMRAGESIHSLINFPKS